MANDYSANFKEKTGSTSCEAPLVLLEITHDQLAAPIRVVNDNQDFVLQVGSPSLTFTALAFRITLPEQMTGSLPKARLAIDNVGRELVQWIDQSNGGAGARVRIMQVMRDDPAVIELDLTLDLLNVQQNALEIVGELGYDDTLGRPAILAIYRPENTPGMF